jgi:predicted amidohydrolase
MARIVTLAAAQMGPIARTETRAQVVERLLAMMRQAKSMGADVVAYPEAALTAFFPHWYTEDEAEVDALVRGARCPGPQTQPLFDEARRLGIGFHLGYCELDRPAGRKRRFNTAILVDAQGRIIGKYRKIHLPGHPTTARRRRSRTWRNATSRSAISASAPGAPTAVSPA